MADVDLSEFYRLATGRKKRQCAVGRALAALDTSSAKQLQAALDADDLPTPPIKKWCKARDLVVSDPAVRHHREQNCSCFDEH